MTKSDWRKASRSKIYSVLLEQDAQAALMGEDLDPKLVLKAISKAYPFAGRENHPYKQWLKEVAIARKFLKCGYQVREYYAFCERQESVARGWRLDRGGKIVKPVEGQMSLFGGDRHAD